MGTLSEDLADEAFGNTTQTQSAGGSLGQSLSDEAFAGGAARQTAPAREQKAGPFPGYKNPKDEGWAEWIGKNITGRQDPRYKDLPSFEQAMLKEDNEGGLKGLRGATPFVTEDKGLANVAARSLGDRFVRHETDAYDYPVLVYKGKDGTEQKAYLNKPGLDSEDVARGTMQAVPYLIGGGLAGAATKGSGLLLNALTQAGAGGSTSILGDLTGNMLGSESGMDAKKAAVVGGLSGAVPIAGAAIAPLVRRFITVPGLYDAQTGQLTAKGAAAAQQAGIDPLIMTREVAQQFAEEAAKNGATTAGKTVLGREFDIPVSRGQVTKDPGQLLTEKAMRTDVYGAQAKGIMQDFDKRQAAAIDAAARGGADAKQSVAYTLNKGTPAQGTNANAMGETIRSSLGEAEQAASANASAAWKNVGQIPPTPEAIAELPKFVGGKIGNLPIDPKITPSATAMVKDLRAYMKGGLPNDYSDVIGRQATPDVVEMRKRLLSTMRSAVNDTDRAAARAVYEGYGDWIEQSATAAMNNGNPLQAAALKTATDRTRELKAVFGETGPDGASPGRKIIQSIMSKEGEATPERIVSSLFMVDTGAQPKAGAVEALNLMKTGFDRYLPPERAAQAWADVKLAAWKRVVEDRAGNLYTPTMMAKRIDQLFASQGAVASTLFAPEERQMVRRFGMAMREIAWKDPNPSGTATANAFYMKQYGQAVIRMLGAADGPLGFVISSLFNSTVRGPVGMTMANRALKSTVPASYSSLPPAAAAFGTRGYLDQQQP